MLSPTLLDVPVDRRRYPAYAIIDVGSIANQAHSDWLQWAAEGGIPFALAILTLFVWCLRPAFGSIWGLGVISVFVHATVDYPFSRPGLGSWTMVIIAMLAAHTTRSNAAYPTASLKEKQTKTE